MGWAYGEHDGRPIGYAVMAKCDEEGCREVIDRGLAFVCGSDVYGGEHGCGKFFCWAHKEHVAFAHERKWPELCRSCRQDLIDNPEYEYDDSTGEWHVKDR